jgi:glutamate synthase (NADPH) small chain
MPEKPPSKLDLRRRDMPKQDALLRSQNFFEVALGYTADLAVEEALRCLQCKKPLCVANCPVQINIPDRKSVV